MQPHDLDPFAQSDLFGGKGTVLVWDLLGQTRIAPFEAVLACELEAGGSVGEHVQQAFPEIVICTEGVGEAHVDGQPFEPRPGRVVPLPHGQTLRLTNLSASEPLRYLIIKAAAHHQSQG